MQITLTLAQGNIHSHKHSYNHGEFEDGGFAGKSILLAKWFLKVKIKCIPWR